MADGDYPGGRTPWENYNVPDLAGVLTENLGPAWDQVRAWYDTAGMAGSYVDALRRFRENLGKVWPAERSPAAKAYLAQLDSLIASVDDVRDAASGNGEALNGVLSALEGARTGMDRLLAEWKRHEAVAVSAGQRPDYWGRDQPRQVELNQKAQQQMHELDAATGLVLSGGPGPGSAPASVAAPISAGPTPGSPSSGSLWIDTPAGRVLRAGAVIGMRPPPPAAGSAGADGARPGGRPSSTASSAAPGEPVGAGERAANGMLGGAPYGGAARAGRDRRGRRSEPYVEWEVPKGVPPVLEPGPEPTHDPGPGVIGIDR
jgi:hypothetical protein